MCVSKKIFELKTKCANRTNATVTNSVPSKTQFFSMKTK